MSGPTFPGASEAEREGGLRSETAEASASGDARAAADAAVAEKRSLAAGAAVPGRPGAGASGTAMPAPEAAVPMASPSPGPVVAPLVPAGVPANQLPPVVLAYIGDAVFEVYVRQYLIANIVRKPHELHRASTRYVSAAAQARLLRRWMPLLTEEEADIARRGRNAKSGQPPKNADPGEYRHATGLECLVGYLYYRGERDRLERLIGLAFADDPTTSEKGPDHHE
ncbi:Mini-ribonuclease 3 [Cohnella xylanilytica]|uniref:Mini-ribonuclease 3 n=1 Tax=Cohnella xylanilytica TaxID=557555 RepID=UPI0035710E89